MLVVGERCLLEGQTQRRKRNLALHVGDVGTNWLTNWNQSYNLRDFDDATSGRVRWSR